MEKNENNEQEVKSVDNTSNQDSWVMRLGEEFAKKGFKNKNGAENRTSICIIRSKKR